MKEDSGRASPGALIKTIRAKISANKRKGEKRAAGFQLVTTKILTLEDSSGEVESVAMPVSDSSLCLFGQLVCRLAVCPYTTWQAARTGRLMVGGHNTWARLAHWSLQLWPSSVAFRRGEQPLYTLTVDSGSVVRRGENTNTFTIHNQGQTDIELTTGDGEETDWIRDIRNHIQDCGDWHQAAPGQMEILSPSKVSGGTLTRQSNSCF